MNLLIMNFTIINHPWANSMGDPRMGNVTKMQQNGQRRKL